MRDLMRLGVVKGTGSKANAKGYLVGGKTGTEDKAMGRGFARNARIPSFVGAFPMDDPRYVAFAMVDEPKPTQETKGYPTARRVAAAEAGRRDEPSAAPLGTHPHSSSGRAMRCAACVQNV